MDTLPSTAARPGHSWCCKNKFLIAAVLALLFFPASSFSQLNNSRRSIPVINKLNSNSPLRSAFAGSVQSFDRKLKILNVNGNQGENTAIFPLGKKVKISSITGQKLKLASLTPGTNVIVYFQQQGGRRKVQQIVVLDRAGSKSYKKKPRPS